MRVTISDVALYAGVNKATVSRALKGDSRISAATRDKVWKAARSLGYEPDAGARGLSSNNTGLGGVVFPKLDESWTGPFLEGLDRVLCRHGTDLIIKNTVCNPVQRLNVLKSLRSRRVDGIVWLDNDFPGADNNRMPVVSVGSVLKGSFSIVPDVQNTLDSLQRIEPGKQWLISITGCRTFGCMYINALKSDNSRDSMFTVIDYIPPANMLKEKKLAILGVSGKCAIPGSYHVDFPYFEIGSLAGRLYLNGVYSRGVRPATVLVNPLIKKTDQTILTTESTEICKNLE